MTELSEELREQLMALDTPTVCNALEIVAPKRRGYGYTVQPLVCTRPELPPMVGVARTASEKYSSGSAPLPFALRHGLLLETFDSQADSPAS